MGNIQVVNCVLAEEAADKNNNLPGLMKRTCQRFSLRRSYKLSNSPLSTPKHSKKRLVLQTMPRCSSYENLTSVLPPSKKSDIDPIYSMWKRTFEQQQRQKPAEVVQSRLMRMRRRVHNMSSAVSGHLTPKGFPAFTKRSKTSKTKKSLQLPQLNESPRAERKIPVMYAEQQQVDAATHIQLPQKVTMTGTVSSVLPKYNLAPLNLLSKLSRSKQAIIIEQLYHDIKEMESRFDTQIDTFIM